MGDPHLRTDLGRVLVTGGSGFVGTNLVTELLDRGHRVHSFDRVPSPLPPREGLVTIVGDITDTDDPSYRFWKYDVKAVGVPLTLVVSRPDGVESRRALVPDVGLGGHSLVLPLLADAASGTWSVAAYADPKGKAIGETTFLVEDYVPERLTLAVTPDQAKKLVFGADHGTLWLSLEPSAPLAAS